MNEEAWEVVDPYVALCRRCGTYVPASLWEAHERSHDGEEAE